MAYKFQVGSFTASGSIKAESGFDAGDSNITNVGDINADSISVDAATAGLNVDFSGANTGLGLITLGDNLASALDVKEGSNSYLKFDTQNSAEVIVASKKVRIADDTKLAFGNGDDASFEYDEDGTDTLLYSGASIRISDDTKLEFGTGGDCSFEYDEDGNDVLLYAGNAIRIGDDTKLEFGAGGDASFEYDEDGTDTLLYAGASIRIGDDTKLEFGAGGDASFEYDEDGNDVLLYAGANIRIPDDTKIEFGAAGDAGIEYDENGDDTLRIHAPAAGVTIAGTTPTITIGDGGDEDTKLVFDQSGQDFYVGVDATDDDLKIGLGNAVGTNTAITLNGDANVTMAGNLTVDGDLTISGTTTTVDTTNLLVKDKLITINDGGAASSAGGAGIEFEEDGSATGFIKTSANRAEFELQAPANNNTLTIDMDAAGEIEFSAAKKLTVGGNFNIDGDIGSTAAELNLLDGSAKSTSSITVADADAIIIIDGSTTKQIPASDLKTYIGAGSLSVASGSSGGGGGSGTIGAAEDGSYADGLFTDFASSTPVGTAVDKFNEVLKILAPSPAPNLSLINADSRHGVSTKLSFDGSNSITGYSASATAAGFSAVARNSAYASASSGNNIRLGTYAIHDITGALNYNTAPSVTNTYVAYASGAFGNAETGSLQLEVNGAVLHSVNLGSFGGTGNPATGSGASQTGNSGFVSLSATASSFDGNNAEWYIFKHRTAKYKISSEDQRKGWNYARVLHVIGATTYSTNYVEWVADPVGSAVALTATGARIEDIVLRGSKYLSGVQYNTGSNANYKVLVNNMYRNVYPSTSNTITFGVTNSSTPTAQSVPSLGGGEDNTKSIGVTGSLAVNVTNLLSSSLTANINATHPLKANLSSAGSATTGNGFLIDNRTLASSNLTERFHDETFRITSASYDTQSSVTASAAQWNSETHMTGSNVDGHQDGLLLYNQRLYSPVDGDIPNGGNFSTLLNVESGQPNYSSVSGDRTFYRVITNSSGVTVRDFKIVSTKSSTTYNNSSLGAANAHLFIKIPGTTGWMDISQNFVYGQVQNGDGALISGASNDVDSGDNTHNLTFGTASVANGGKVLIKIVADESWSGYISQLEFRLSASIQTPVAALVLDDIDANNSGVSDANLSFGASNVIDTYSSVSGSSISLTNFNTNDNYSLSGDRRGVFSSKPTLTGELNEDVSASGSNYSVNAFRNGFTGSLILQVNGATLRTTSLMTLENIQNDFNGNSSGFNLGPVQFSTTADGVPDYTKAFRTGSYQIGANDQNLGWNYARVIHRIGGTDTNTNYVEWVVDTDSNALTSANVAISNFNNVNIYHQSGVKYFAAPPTASYTYTAGNVYRNVYQDGTAITFPTTTHCSISNIRISGSGINTTSSAASSLALGTLNNTADCHLRDIEVTGTVLFDHGYSLVGSSPFTTGSHTASVTSRIIHPHKSTLNTASKSKSGFLVFSGSIGSTNTNTEEYFNMESYRRISSSYDTQGMATGSHHDWDSSKSMNSASDAAYVDGLLVFNGFLVSPVKGGESGSFINVEEGGSLQGPSSNVNYASEYLSSSVRTFYRYYRNNTTNDRSSITVTMYGSGSLVNKSTALGSNGNYHMEIKIPGNTGWLDAGKAYPGSPDKDTDGTGMLVGGSSPTPISTSGTSVSTTFGNGSLQGTVSASPSGEVAIVKISAHKDWIGYLSRLKVAYS